MNFKDSSNGNILSKFIYLVPGSLRSFVSKIPGIAAAQRWVLKYLGPKGKFLHQIDFGPAKGLVLPLELPEDKAMWKGDYELTFCLKLQKAVTPNAICFDVGAYRGYTGGVMALAGAKAVYAFEPMPENQINIQKIIEVNRNLPLTLIPKAVSRENGFCSLVLSNDHSMNRLEQTNNSYKKEESIMVETVTLDSISDALNSYPELLKIDVEGAEFDVLKGGLSVLQKYTKVLFIELHNSQAEKDCLKLLSELNFNCVWKDKDWGHFTNQAIFEKK